MTVIEEILNCKATDEVNSIIEDINMALKSVRDTINGKKKFQFSVGNTVLVREKNGSKTEGTILKINRSKAKVKMNGTTYNVPFSIMELKGTE